MNTKTYDSACYDQEAIYERDARYPGVRKLFQ